MRSAQLAPSQMRTLALAPRTPPACRSSHRRHWRLAIALPSFLGVVAGHPPLRSLACPVARAFSGCHRLSCRCQGRFASGSVSMSVLQNTSCWRKRTASSPGSCRDWRTARRGLLLASPPETHDRVQILSPRCQRRQRSRARSRTAGRLHASLPETRNPAAVLSPRSQVCRRIKSSSRSQSSSLSPRQRTRCSHSQTMQRLWSRQKPRRCA
mmetsp:Transcript_118199/g.294902  ORF Transcript_118199/g.294902 Transcript_118199/m.294902 type:complete len:211 (-) Transcript_118199:2750-3382(-)